MKLGKCSGVLCATLISSLSVWAQTDGCANEPSPEACRQKAAAALQTELGKTSTHIHVTSGGKTLIFTDAEAFVTQANRAAFHDALETTALDKEVCQFGFQKIRIQATDKENSGEDYDLLCEEVGTPQDQDDPKPKDPGAVSGKVFLITQGGDLKPARLAQVILLYGGVLGGSQDAGTASIFYHRKKVENLKASWPSPGHPTSCRSDLLIFNNSLKSTLEWGQTTGKATAQIQITTSDEEGAFQFPKVPIGEYTVLAWGHAGFNDAYWEESLKVQPGQSVALKLSSPHLACLD